jgi:hypothetical protein
MGAKRGLLVFAAASTQGLWKPHAAYSGSRRPPCLRCMNVRFRYRRRCDEIHGDASDAIIQRSTEVYGHPGGKDGNAEARRGAKLATSACGVLDS